MLAEISLNVVDIVQNSVKAGASVVDISLAIDRTKNELKLRISDDGKGMNEETLKHVVDPFFTSRKTRNVGLGIPFLKQGAECTGGTFSIESKEGEGTSVEAVFMLNHIDCMPLGDINSSIYMMVTTAADSVDYVYHYKVDDKEFTLDTREVKEIMQGESLQNREVAAFIKAFLEDNKREVDGEE